MTNNIRLKAININMCFKENAFLILGTMAWKTEAGNFPFERKKRLLQDCHLNLIYRNTLLHYQI